MRATLEIDAFSWILSHSVYIVPQQTLYTTVSHYMENSIGLKRVKALEYIMPRIFQKSGQLICKFCSIFHIVNCVSLNTFISWLTLFNLYSRFCSLPHAVIDYCQQLKILITWYISRENTPFEMPRKQLIFRLLLAY